MKQLTREDLYSLEEYARIRQDFRAQVMAHKRSRQVQVGPSATLYFEDALTMKYQVQEMLRAERIFEAEEIQGELDAYNPLIPDGSNWKATFMLEYPDAEIRHEALARLKGVEDRVFVRVEGFDPVFAVADEDLERENETKTSSVHFLRFDLTPPMVAAVRTGAGVSVGIDHPSYAHVVSRVADAVRASLAGDLG
jgi:hypothetical protein